MNNRTVYLIAFLVGFTLTCARSHHPTVTPAPLVDGVPECEAR